LEDTLQEDLLSISQAARLLGVQPLTLRRWDNSGVLVPDFRTLGGCRRYSRKRLQEILDRHELPDGRKC
jgi:DNA-binding transcriptional MerR regulator